MPKWNKEIYYTDDTPKAAVGLLLLAAVDFGYWQVPFTLNHQGQKLDADHGHELMAALWNRAIRFGAQIDDSNWLANLGAGELQAIMHVDDGDLPMLDSRLRNVREVGRVLSSDYGGKIQNLLEAAKGDASEIVCHLSSMAAFSDVASWRGISHRINGRAQRFVWMLADAYRRNGLGNVSGLEMLLPVADSRLIVALRASGVISVEDSLASKIESEEIIGVDSVEETSLRSVAIHAVVSLAQILTSADKMVTATDVERMIYSMELPVGAPKRHRTLTTAY